MTPSLPGLSPFTPSHLAAPDEAGPDEWHHHRLFMEALQAWLESEPGFAGLEAAIAELNAHGHALASAPCGSEGWVIFRGPLPEGDCDLQISASREGGGEIMLTTPMSDAAWQKQLDDRRAGLTEEEREIYDLQQEFYDRGGALFIASDDWESLDEGDRVLLAVYFVENEVANGGFSQYFVNTGGLLVEEACRGFEQVGAPHAANLVRQAMTLVGGPFGDDLTDEQYKALDSQSDALDALDDAYYALEEDVATLVMRWRKSRE